MNAGTFKVITLILFICCASAVNVELYACESSCSNNKVYDLWEPGEGISNDIIDKCSTQLKEMPKKDEILLFGGLEKLWKLCVVEDVQGDDVSVKPSLNIDCSCKKKEDLRRPKLPSLYCSYPSDTEFKSLINRVHKLLPAPDEYTKISEYFLRYGNAGLIQVIIGKPEVPVNVTGDVHADRQSLRTNLYMKYVQKLIDNKLLSKDCRSVYLGDNIGRYVYGVEVLAKLLQLKEQDDNLFLLRGNHESMVMTMVDGFGSELCKKYGEEASSSVLERLQNLFSRLPQLLIIGSCVNELKHKYSFGYYCHGGINKNLTGQINGIIRKAVARHIKTNDHINMIDCFDSRNNVSGNAYLDSGLMWGDFYSDSDVPDGEKPSHRGVFGVYSYSKSAAKKYLQDELSGIGLADQVSYSYRVDFIARGHAHIPGGIVELAYGDKKGEECWKPLESGKTYQVKPGTVFSCTSTRFDDDESKCEASFAVFKVEKDGEWSITPYIQKCST